MVRKLCSVQSVLRLHTDESHDRRHNLSPHSMLLKIVSQEGLKCISSHLAQISTRNQGWENWILVVKFHHGLTKHLILDII